MQAEQMMEQLMGEMSEELIPELLPYLEDGVMGKQIRHPLIYQVPLWSNGSANRMYSQKKSEVARARKEKDWSRFVFLHERPYRLNALLEIQDQLKDTQYWSLLADTWIDTENAWQNRAKWRKLFNSNRPYSNYLMSEEEDNAMRSLPQMVTIYRGTSFKNEKGLSWTLSKEKAEFFAQRFNASKGRVLEKQVDKDQILAVFLGRGESEVILKGDK
jgi:hypothetical protein